MIHVVALAYGAKVKRLYIYQQMTITLLTLSLRLARIQLVFVFPLLVTPFLFKGIPYGTVNLKRGVPEGETTVSSLAGAGSLSVEFSVLSALTGDGVFAEVSTAGQR